MAANDECAIVLLYLCKATQLTEHGDDHFEPPAQATRRYGSPIRYAPSYRS